MGGTAEAGKDGARIRSRCLREIARTSHAASNDFYDHHYYDFLSNDYYAGAYPTGTAIDIAGSSEAGAHPIRTAIGVGLTP